MKKLIFLLTASFIIFCIQACSKKDKTASKAELLTSGTWKLTTVVADEDGNGTYETDRFATFSDCYTDNIWSFTIAALVVMDEGPTKCAPTDPQTENGSWQFTQNETHLRINADEWKLEELTTGTLKWKEEYAGGRSSLVTFAKR